jgi:hypothetical protein
MLAHAAVNYSFLQSMTQTPYAASSTQGRQDEISRSRYKLVSEEGRRSEDRESAAYAEQVGLRTRKSQHSKQAWGSANVSQEQRSRNYNPRLSSSSPTRGRNPRAVSSPDKPNRRSSTDSSSRVRANGNDTNSWGKVTGLNENNLAQERVRELSDEVSGLRRTVQELKEALAAGTGGGSDISSRRQPQNTAMHKDVGEHEVVDRAFLSKVEQLRVDHENNLDLIELLMKEKIKSDERARQLEKSVEFQTRRSTQPSQPTRSRPLRERKIDVPPRRPVASAPSDSDELWKATVSVPESTTSGRKYEGTGSGGQSSGPSSRDSEEGVPLYRERLLSNDDDALLFVDEGGDESAAPPPFSDSEDREETNPASRPSGRGKTLHPVRSESPPYVRENPNPASHPSERRTKTLHHDPVQSESPRHVSRSEIGWAERVHQSFAATKSTDPSSDPQRRGSKTVDLERLTRHTSSSASMLLKAKGEKDHTQSSENDPLNLTLRQKRKEDERRRAEEERRQACNFKARPVPKSTGECKLQQSVDGGSRFVSIAEKEQKRKEQIQARAAALLGQSSMPPRMQRHDDTDPGSAKDTGRRRKSTGLEDAPPPFKARAVPNFDAQKSKWDRTLQKVKSENKETKPVSFSMMSELRLAEENAKRSQREQKEQDKLEEQRQRDLQKISREKKLITTLESMHSSKPSATTKSVCRRDEHNKQKKALLDEKEAARTKDRALENGVDESGRALRDKKDPHAAVDEKARQLAKDAKQKYREELKKHEEKIRDSLKSRPSLVGRQQETLEREAAKREALKTVAMTVYGDEQDGAGSKWKKLAKGGDLFDESEKAMLGLMDNDS